MFDKSLAPVRPTSGVTTEPRAPVKPELARHGGILSLAAGPLAFLVLATLPVTSPSYGVRCGLGLLLWLASWWLTRPVHLAVTGLLPLAVVALFGFVPVGDVLPSYADELIILLVGANILTTAWARWGLDRRIALTALAMFGSGPKPQRAAWFIVSVLLATLLPRVVVAATLIPIVAAMLKFIGVEDLWTSHLGTSLVLAVAWGSSLGGFLTPLGGAPNLLAMKFVQDLVTHHEFLFTTWVTRLTPLTIAVVVAVLLYFVTAFDAEAVDLPLSRVYFRRELSALGPMSAPERWATLLFVLATLLAFSRGAYDRILPSFTPAYAFLSVGLAAFAVRTKGEPLLTWEFAQSGMMWGLFYVFAGGNALGAVLNKAGSAQYLASMIGPFAGNGTLGAVALFATITMVMAQIVSNVATVAIMVPIAISVFQGVGGNPIPIIYVIIAASHCGFMLPSSAGSSAVAAGYGVNLRTMFTHGFWAALICLAVIVAVAFVSILIWPGFATA
jgi:solute carrier family 13 (sodium-dependent dicarboxylate transporter), member 2/3/5